MKAQVSGGIKMHCARIRQALECRFGILDLEDLVHLEMYLLAGLINLTRHSTSSLQFPSVAHVSNGGFGLWTPAYAN